MTCSPEVLFRDALQSVFGPLDWLPVPDGAIQRFHVPGDRSGTLNGWYALFLDGIASGAFGSWKTGEIHRWSIRKPADHLEAHLIAQRIEQARHQREAEQHQRQQAAANEASARWSRAVPASQNHPYLVAKGVKPHGLRQSGDVLLAPLYADGELVNLQRIAPDGGKRFLPGALVKGAYSPLGRIEAGKPLYICEGWATGATIHEETGCPVACAMNAGNLLAVGQYLRRRYPDAVLIVAGDDDRQTESNPGRTKANHAAALLGCGVVFPPWPAGAPLHLTDFNDLRQWLEAHP
ncbi:topoisomerase [Azotobacter chroococcum]|uniref:Topoisomerase n=1 Tax=Azotobacter chroococcum TaxID=353 RepID=A0AA43Z4Y0_9GAMM|nr:toprim domain-containing protein [Azotobacter chroococcum]NHN76695.1 topoisomerase [Azotobacter chroococcum]